MAKLRSLLLVNLYVPFYWSICTFHSICLNLLSSNPTKSSNTLKIIKHTQTICWLSLANCLSLLDNFMWSVLKRLTLAFDWAVLYGNIAFSIAVFSTKKQYSSFLKELLVFQKTCFKVKILKTLKIFRKDTDILNWGLFKKSPVQFFWGTYNSFCWL